MSLRPPAGLARYLPTPRSAMIQVHMPLHGLVVVVVPVHEVLDRLARRLASIHEAGRTRALPWPPASRTGSGWLASALRNMLLLGGVYI